MKNWELEALIDEKIMGCIDGVGPGKVLAYSQDRGFFNPDHIPHYCTDLTAAWQVNLKIRAIKMDTDEAYQVVAKYTQYINEAGIMDLPACDAAKIICLAALKAIGAPVAIVK